MNNLDMDVVVATRFWGSTETDWKRLSKFIERAQDFGVALVVGINTAEDKLDSKRRILQRKWGISTHVEEINPWDGVCEPLNRIVSAAVDKFEAKWILFHSPEVEANVHNVNMLKDKMMQKKDGCLVVGHGMHGHAEFGADSCGGDTEWKTMNMSGRSCPWNTLALWDVRRLQRTRFVGVADYVEPAGMEEVGTIAVQRQRYGENDSFAMVVHDKSGRMIDWKCEFDSKERRQKHEKKMQSKNRRTKEILRHLGMEEGDVTVTHTYY